MYNIVVTSNNLFLGFWAHDGTMILSVHVFSQNLESCDHEQLNTSHEIKASNASWILQIVGLSSMGPQARDGFPYIYTSGFLLPLLLYIIFCSNIFGNYSPNNIPIWWIFHFLWETLMFSVSLIFSHCP